MATNYDMYKIQENTDIWVPADGALGGGKPNEVFVTASVVQIDKNKKKKIVTLRRHYDSEMVMFDLPLPKGKVLARVATVDKASKCHDLVSLSPPHVSNILHLLGQRSTKHEQPYTFVGPVLVSVNPVQRADKKALKKLEKGPHPFRIAETSIKQLKFARHRAATGGSGADSIINQSIVISGESGAGKTENAKMVLARLVELLPEKKSSKSSGDALDKRLIDTNPILEAFGNAKTVRNHNSSRFGKFLKLHVEGSKIQLTGGSVETYLLERSRVVHVSHGERNYHIFYLLLAGLKGEKNKSGESYIKKLGLPDDCSASTFKYLRPTDISNTTPSKRFSVKHRTTVESHRTPEDERADFKKLKASMKAVGMTSELQEKIFQVLAAILHLGEISIVGKDGTPVALDPNALASTDKTVSDCDKTGKNVITNALGISFRILIQGFCQREIKSGKDIVMADNSLQNATRAKDSLAKSLYSKLFDWIVSMINSSLQGKSKSDDRHFIGVLDIFGFETFTFNDLEQLLINYTNEALHGIFLKKVFEAELSMYREEGLVDDEAHKNIVIPHNIGTMDLLIGHTPENGGKRTMGILDIIVDEAKNPNATDSKMLQRLQKTFSGNEVYFPLPHKKDMAHKFKVLHYSQIVSYDIGNFLLKNHDRLPGDLDKVIKSSSSFFIKDLWGGTGEEEEKAGQEKKRATSKRLSLAKLGNAIGGGRKGGANNGTSIIVKFKRQIATLCATLESSQCSFIRCVKPNYFLKREDGSDSWFDKNYVFGQLTSLGIEPTVQVLSKGMPSRIPYDDFQEKYRRVLSRDCLSTWKKMGSDPKMFTGAVLWAFQIPPEDYKLGFKRVFFKSGNLEKVEEVLDVDLSKMSSTEVKKTNHRFKQFLMRSKWRHCFAVVCAANAFLSILNDKKMKAKVIRRKKEMIARWGQRQYRRWKAEEAKSLKERQTLSKAAVQEQVLRNRKVRATERSKTSDKATAQALKDANLSEKDSEVKKVRQALKKFYVQQLDNTRMSSDIDEFQRQIMNIDTSISRAKQRVTEEASRNDADINLQDMDFGAGRHMAEQAYKMQQKKNYKPNVYKVDREVKDFVKSQEKEKKGIRSSQKKAEKKLKDSQKKMEDLQKKVDDASKKLKSKLKKKESKLYDDVMNHLRNNVKNQVEAERLAKEEAKVTKNREKCAKNYQRSQENRRKSTEARSKVTKAVLEEHQRKKNKHLKRKQDLIDESFGELEQEMKHASSLSQQEHPFLGSVRTKKLLRSKRKWKNRYFRLSPNFHKLTYYVKYPNQQEKGKVILTDATTCVKMKSHDFKGDKSITCGIRIDAPSMTTALEIGFNDSAQRDAALSKIDAVLKNIKNSGAMLASNKHDAGATERREFMDKLYQRIESGLINKTEAKKMIKAYISVTSDEVISADKIFTKKSIVDDGGFYILCENCGTENTTSTGPKCTSCKEPLNVNPIEFL